MISLGRSKYLSWGITASATDVSDLFREKISDDGKKFFVDGNWRNLEILSHDIKVKGKESPVRWDVQKTHRGPVIPSSMIKNAQLLFFGKPPVDDAYGNFSLAWSGHSATEEFTKIMMA